MNLPIEQHWMKRARVLTQALIISGTLNIGLLSTFIYFILKERQELLASEVQVVSTASKQSFTNDQILRAYSRASFQELLARLENKDLVEDGYAKRDLALACLTHFHYFPLSKVLGESDLQKRMTSFQSSETGEAMNLIVFSGLKDEHFKAVLRFARTERWPLTVKGLFLLLQKKNVPYDSSLLDAFYVTPEFHHIQTLLQKSAPSIEKSALVELIKAGSWERFEKISERLRHLQVYDEESSRNVLMTYAFGFGSKVAASALLQHQSEFVIKRLNDEQVLSFYDFNIDQQELLESMSKELLLSPRSDVVRQKAAAYLYSISQELMPQPYDHQHVLSRFFPEKIQSVQSVKPVLVEEKVSKQKVHVIQEGDSLWKIARKYGTTVEAIMKLNNLESERLRLNRKLEIPEKSL
jgi:LysM repeat protein